MEDSDSELEVLSTMMSQSKKKAWIPKLEKKMHADDDSLFETVKQKRRKMNKKKRVVLKNGLTNVSYKNISMKKGVMSLTCILLFLIPPGRTLC